MSDLLNPKIDEFPTRLYKNIKGKRVAYRDVGNGPIVFCIPPWPSSSLAYFQISELLKDKFRFISVDLPGFGGESEWLGEFSIEEFGEFVKDFVRSFETNDYYFIGYSFGGMLVQYCIGQSIINPKKVIYVSTLHTANDVWDVGKKYFNLLDKVDNIVQDLNRIKDFIKWVYVVRLLVKKRNSNDKSTKSSLIRAILKEDESVDANMIFSMWGKLKDIEVLNPNLRKVKSLIIYGDEDPLFLQNECEELAEYLNIKPIKIEGNHDHFSFFAQKSKLYIEDFLDRNRFSIFDWLSARFA